MCCKTAKKGNKGRLSWRPPLGGTADAQHKGHCLSEVIFDNGDCNAVPLFALHHIQGFVRYVGELDAA
jgi:hypothetical protein